MKYVVLIYSNPATWETLPKAEQDRVLGDHWKVIHELEQSGEMLGRFGLSDPGSTKTIRIEGGVPVITDGPFGEAKEQLAGVFLVDGDNLERVLEYSGPLAQYSVVEVRPVMDETAGEEM